MSAANESYEIIKSIVSAGGQVVIVSKGRYDVQGPANAGMLFAPLAAKLRAQRDSYDEVCAITLGGVQHEPSSTLGRLSRNLLAWRRGEKIQLDDRPVKNLRGMVDQLYAAIKDAPAGEPEGELEAMILAFKSIVGLHAWKDVVEDWPTYECPPIKKWSIDDPNRNIPELPPPGKKRDDYWIKKAGAEKAAAQQAFRNRVESDDIPF